MHQLAKQLLPKRTLAFGPFRLDLASRLLWRDEEIVPLTAKVFDILLYFVQNSGRVLKKDEVLQAVWPDSFVEEGNLTRNVSTLRKALGEDPHEHKYIVTLPGHGYHFVANVCEVTDERTLSGSVERTSLRVVLEGEREKSQAAIENAAPPGATEAVAPAASVANERKHWRASRPVVVVIVAAVVALMAAFFVRAKRATAPAFSLPLKMTRLTSSGDVYAPTISPDGKYLAYSPIGLEGDGLSIRQVATGSVAELIPPARVFYWGIAFLPDGYVYYILADKGAHAKGTLYRVPSLGGHPQKLIEHVNGGPTFSPDGRQLAFVRMNAAPDELSIITANVDGSDQRTIKTVYAPTFYQSSDWSPDGKTILYALRQRTPEGDSWYIAERLWCMNE